MAYMSQEKKKELSPAINAVLRKHNVKGSISVRHHSTLIVKLRQGDIDFGDSTSVNEYHIERDFEGEQRDFLKELHTAMMRGNHNNSDPMTDYFDVGWYTEIKIGEWDKPYICTKVEG